MSRRVLDAIVGTGALCFLGSPVGGATMELECGLYGVVDLHDIVCVLDAFSGED